MSTITTAVSGPATRWAEELLQEFAISHQNILQHDAHSQRDWAQSGAMWLTGESEGPPCCNPVPLASCARGAMLALSAIAPGTPLPVGPELLGERAAIFGLRRAGRVSPGGSCRLLRAADGWIAINLPRDEDWLMLQALLETEAVINWAQLESIVAHATVEALLFRGRMLGLAVAPVDNRERPPRWCVKRQLGSVRRVNGRRPRVVDLSSLWAGPLCGNILGMLGAEVIKVESIQRPDGARRGPVQFFDLLNAGKASVALDFRQPQGQAALRALLRSADIVIEASRPRAMRQLGIDAESLVGQCPGITWISITGYGRDIDEGMRVAFGDDAGVAGGLTQRLSEVGQGLIVCGDAVADPLAGMHAAVAGWACWRSGGGCLLDVSLAGVVARCAALSASDAAPVIASNGQWWIECDGEHFPVLPPRARSASERGRSLGVDTEAVLAGLREQW